MTINDQVFSITGDKKSTLLAGDDAFKISSKDYYTAVDFEEGWNKKLSFETKVKIKYDTLRVVTKEEHSRQVYVKYKTALGFTSSHSFAFSDENDYGRFFHFLQEGLYMKKEEAQLSPLKAASGYLLGLAFTLAITLFFHYEAVAMENGAAITGSGKTRAVLSLVKLLGVKGVWIAGVAIMGFIAFNAYKRYTNPPVQTRFVATH